nr:hypothetical protein [Tanacetum cinerariifolium]
MASESASASATTDIGSTSAPTIREIISTNQNPRIWKDFNLCIMTDNSQKAQFKHCFHFLSQCSNMTLRNHVTHPHCEVIKAQKNQNPKAGQTSMARDGSVFRYDPDYLREQFAAIPLYDEEIALDASSEDTISSGGPRESTGGGSVGFCCYAVVVFDNLVVGYVEDVEIVVEVVIVRIVVDEIVLIVGIDDSTGRISIQSL